MRFQLFVTGLSGLLIALSVNAADVPFVFDDEAEAERYRDLVEELRCLVCQNQSLADSNADLAQDLRDEIYQMIQDGKTDDEIVGFMVDRYGDFVLYRPPLNAITVLLWFGPLVIFAVAVLIIVRILRQQAAQGEGQLQETGTRGEQS